jgi:hypothetical protein
MQRGFYQRVWYQVLRFTNEEVYRKIDGILDSITQVAQEQRERSVNPLCDKEGTGGRPNPCGPLWQGRHVLKVGGPPCIKAHLPIRSGDFG